jgi:CHC2 zinc finger/Toprim domain
MPILHRDFETRSALDLKTVGAWRYAADASTSVLCVTYAVDNNPVQVWTPDQPIPAEFTEAARDPSWTIVAHNDQFETVVETLLLHPRFGWPLVPIERHRCTMVAALAYALPAGLDRAAAALGLSVRKDDKGARLMKLMAKPRRPRKGEEPNIVHWHDGAEQRARLAQYCIRDVEVERELHRHLPPLSDDEQQLWVLDATINMRGFRIDRDLALAAREIVVKEQSHINSAVGELTGDTITGPNQVARIQSYLRERGVELKTLSKTSVAAALAKGPSDEVRQLLELRRDGGRSSARKLDTLLAGLDDDNRLRGTFRFYGAGTGRWSGSRFQPQNLKNPETENLDGAIEAILSRDLERVRALGAPLSLVGDVSRSMIYAAPGMALIGADYSAIESRVLAWLAGEQWKVDAYAEYDRTGDPALEPYCVTASRILKRTVTPEDKAGRKIGKTCDLAFGFGGGLGAYRRFDVSDRYTDGEVETFKREWRAAHAAIVRLWFDLENGLRRAIHTGQPIRVGRLVCEYDGINLYLTLPNGRRLVYPRAHLVSDDYESTQVAFYDGSGGRWTKVRGWHGLFVENTVQAVARDLLAAAMLRLEAAGYTIVLHVHDEAVAEVPAAFGGTEQFVQLMTALPAWAAGLPVTAEAWTGVRYGKGNAPKAPEPATVTTGTITTSTALTVPVVKLPAKPAASIGDTINCPFHDDGTPSLKLYADHFHCYGCGAHGDLVDWLMMMEGLTRNEAVQTLDRQNGQRALVAPVMDTQVKRARDIKRAMQLWAAARPIAGTLAARYLADRRRIDLDVLPDDVDEALRFHPHCPFADSEHPALLGLMRAPVTDEPTGIHRIALTPLGDKIDRWTLGSRGVVKLWAATAQLVVGEGIETVLAAATRITHKGEPLRPAWAAVSSGQLKTLPVVPVVEHLVVLVDHDINGAGQSAAAQCAERWIRAGRTVTKHQPRRPGDDFNDVVMREFA